MTTLEDSELLRRYATDRSEAAFGELVRRHLPPVYTFALRRVGGDAHLAEDVAQIVFTTLSRKASALTERQTLGGWLCRTTHFAARDVVRSERRRRAREQEAQTMEEFPARADAAIDWEKLQPVLNETMGELKDDDRDAVWLRFFEGRSFAEVGAKLRLTENAARMRVERALHKLHGLLARRGVTSTTAALGLALANQASVAAPAGLAQLVTGAALAAGSVGFGGGALFLTMTKLQTGLIAMAAVAGVTALTLTLNLKTHPTLPAAQDERRVQSGAFLVTGKGATHANAAPRVEAKSQPVSSASSSESVIGEAIATAASPTPKSSITAVDDLVNAGRATPGAAFQTLVWAALKGNDGELAASLALSKGAREKAAVWRASLPLEDQAQFTPLEKLPGLFLAEEVLRKAAGLEVLEVSDEKEGQATLHVRMVTLDGRVSEDRFPMMRSEGEWQMLLPEKMINSMRRSFEQKGPKKSH